MVCCIWICGVGVCGVGVCYLLERLTEFSEDVLLVKHLALEAVFVVLMDLLSNISRKFMERHVLFHLLVLQQHKYLGYKCSQTCHIWKSESSFISSSVV